MHKHKLIPIAEGNYSQIFELPGDKNVIVKIADATNKNYQKFVRFCEMKWNQTNPWLPKIIDSFEYKADFKLDANQKFEDYLIVFLEKLTPIPQDKWIKFTKEVLDVEELDGAGSQSKMYITDEDSF